MKTSIFLLFLLSGTMTNAQESTWKPAGDKIKTQWAEQVNPEKPLPEYPRPMLARAEWDNLNGLWEYAITDEEALCPAQFDGKILVPFPIESSLSGVMRNLDKGQALWYQRTFTIPAQWEKKNVLLHFGAVDYHAEVYVNGIRATEHTGGFASFSADITNCLKQGENVLTVKVLDSTDERTQPVGKQRRNPGGPGTIWYTSVSGIWQTVWMEPVNRQYISDIRTTPDLDNNRFIIETKTVGTTPSTDMVHVTLSRNGRTVATAGASAGMPVIINVKKPDLWTPDTPNLYHIAVSLVSKDVQIDKVESYTAMRKISTAPNNEGVWRLQLNNTDLFHFGPLDQGYWPDGLYTAPTDEALLFDIQKTKDWGYNMIRKHMKVEPARWYYYCDSIGVLVWQDMPSIGRSDEYWEPNRWSSQKAGRHSEDPEKAFKNEWEEIINQHYSNPSIVVWTPFNEAWGQFKTAEIVEYTRQLDPTRLINSASGGNHYHCGDFIDLHDYSRPPKLYINDTSRPVVLGEYGGLGCHIKAHRWFESDATTYVNYQDATALTDSYIQQGEAVLSLAKGFVGEDGIHAAYSAAVYTQTTDVETEVNGLMTYDRKVMKMDEERIRRINKAISHALSAKK
ncbi:MAG: beta-galactosidase [Bacteroides sp.]|nr:glycoside hydrolase family 2 [Roseburia sp.]MCM1345518.1 beta-galactosidase [Bacteroides sp.]MCM1420027.1 beta-galactosidase [Bacteroides sp.]